MNESREQFLLTDLVPVSCYPISLGGQRADRRGCEWLAISSALREEGSAENILCVIWGRGRIYVTEVGILVFWGDRSTFRVVLSNPDVLPVDVASPMGAQSAACVLRSFTPVPCTLIHRDGLVPTGRRDTRYCARAAEKKSKVGGGA